MMGLVCSYLGLLVCNCYGIVSTVMEPEWVLAGVNVVPCDGYFNKHIDTCVCVCVCVLSSLWCFLILFYKRNVHVWPELWACSCLGRVCVCVCV